MEEETLQGKADALAPIVPYTSLAVYEVVWSERMLTPLLATGRYVEETLNSRPELDNSITGSAVLKAEVVYLAAGDPLLRKHVMPGTPQGDEDAFLVAPLVVGEHVVGTLNVWREDAPAWFQPEESLLLRRFASLAAMAYANSTQREQLRIQALTDELAGLFNRRHFEHSLSRVLRADSRRDDIPCRTGGEEFSLVLPRTSREEARQVAHRVVDAVRAARLGPRRDLTVSAGVATSPDSSGDREFLVRKADEHLMRAKREGRNRVVLGEGPGR